MANKTEKAINILQERIDLIKKYGRSAPEIIEYREALELAVKALKKQIPMRPNNVQTIFDFSGRYCTTKGNCPVCNIEELYKSDFYCNKCGQKLDWGEEDGR